MIRTSNTFILNEDEFVDAFCAGSIFGAFQAAVNTCAFSTYSFLHEVCVLAGCASICCTFLAML
jgi:hypothetical protein